MMREVDLKSAFGLTICSEDLLDFNRLFEKPVHECREQVKCSINEL